MSNPTIDEAKELARKHGKDIIIILHIDADGNFGYVSYGQSAPLCRYAKSMADIAYDAILGSVMEWGKES